jgi:predicted Fe-Mo cluster-binding NifX family protein
MDRDALTRTTRAAFPFWQGRIAPLFDTAREIRVVETDGTRLVAAHDEVLSAGSVERRAARRAALGIGTVVCGAISRETGRAVETAGVHVVPFVSGELGAVVRAFLDGELGRGDFRMPGCGDGLRRRFRGGEGRGSGGSCVCPACGHARPRVRGVPCVSTECPRCGGAMTRGR